MFRKYEKIHRLGKEETEGILEGTCYIQEKIDGANTSIWREIGNDLLHLGSRNRELLLDKFNGYDDYIQNHKGILQLTLDYPEYILYGEWLVPHTIQYNKESYKQWYLYDIYERDLQAYLAPEHTQALAEEYDIMHVAPFLTLKNPTLSQLQEYVGKSVLGLKGEGIVIKNPQFINKFGDRVCAKVVVDSFMEENALVFGGNNKAADNYQEMYFVQRFINEARLHKVIHKLEPDINEVLDLKHIPRICNSVYYDMIIEECWAIAKLNKQIDFKQLQRLAFNKAKLLYQQYLESR